MYGFYPHIKQLALSYIIQYDSRQKAFTNNAKHKKYGIRCVTLQMEHILSCRQVDHIMLPRYITVYHKWFPYHSYNTQSVTQLKSYTVRFCYLRFSNRAVTYIILIWHSSDLNGWWTEGCIYTWSNKVNKS